MKDLLEKISSYNIFNFLLPGTIFSYLATHLTQFHLIQEDIVIGVFIYYFIGLVVSRIGSLVFAPILIFVLRIKFSPYKEYISAVKVDPKIEVLLEVNNTYRTLFSMMCCTLLLIVVDKLTSYFSISEGTLFTFSAIALAILFGLSYKKQTIYIKNRVENSK